MVKKYNIMTQKLVSVFLIKAPIMVKHKYKEIESYINCTPKAVT
jgi:hypothetical protein